MSPNITLATLPIGEPSIPLGWKEGPLSDYMAAKPKNGFSAREVDHHTGTTVLGLGCLTPDGFKPIHLKQVFPSARTNSALLDDGDLLISRSNTRELVGLVGVYKDTGSPTTYPDLMMRLTPGGRTSARFLEVLLRSDRIRRQIQAKATGTSGSMVKISSSIVQRLEVQVPPELEQARITELLDVLDEAIRETEAIIAKLKATKQGLLHSLLMRGIGTNLKVRPSKEEAPHLYKQSPAGWIPKEWDAIAAIDIIEHLIDFRGRTPRKLGMDWGGGNILALSANNVQPGAIDISREAYFGSERLYQKWMTSGDTRKGDVLLTMEAPLGNVAQIPDGSKYILSQRVIALRFKPTIVLNDFAFWQMQSCKFQQAMVSRSTGSTATGIQRAELVKLLFKAPPVDEQLLIAERLFSLEKRITFESAALAKQRKAKSGLSSDLFNGRVRTCPQ